MTLSKYPMYVEMISNKKRRSLINNTKPSIRIFFKIHVNHQRQVTTSQKNQWQLSPSTTNRTTHNQTKKNKQHHDPPPLAGLQPLHHMSRDRAQSALHGDTFCVRATNN